MEGAHETGCTIDKRDEVAVTETAQPEEEVYGHRWKPRGDGPHDRLTPQYREAL